MIITLRMVLGEGVLNIDSSGDKNDQAVDEAIFHDLMIDLVA